VAISTAERASSVTAPPAEEGTATTQHKLGQDPDSKVNNSPTVYLDDVTGNYLLQGWRVTDVERLAQLDIPAHETVIEFPRRMMQFFPEVNGGSGTTD
jgi:hypothetical protein